MLSFQATSDGLRSAKKLKRISSRNQHSHIDGKVKSSGVCEGILLHG